MAGVLPVFLADPCGFAGLMRLIGRRLGMLRMRDAELRRAALRALKLDFGTTMFLSLYRRYQPALACGL